MIEEVPDADAQDQQRRRPSQISLHDADALRVPTWPCGHGHA